MRRRNLHTNAIEPSASIRLPGIWIESIRRTCRLTVTAFLIFGLVTALSGCASIYTIKVRGIASGSDADLDSIIGISRGSALREYGLPNAQFVNDSDGTTFFVYAGYAIQNTVLYLPFTSAPSGMTYISSNVGGKAYCELLRFGPNDRVLDYAVKNRREYDNCANEFGSLLAGTIKLPIDELTDELAMDLTRLNGHREAAFEMASRYQEPKFIRTLAEQGDTEAAIALASSFQELGQLRKLAEGDVEAATMLAREFDELKYIRELAERGNVEAAFTLAGEFDEPSFIRVLAKQGDTRAATELARSFQETGPLLKLAKSGDAGSAYEIYEITVLMPGHASDSRNWLCKAANEGYVEAQMELGYRHQSVVWKTSVDKIRMQNLREAGFNPDDRIAYMWYTLAAASAETNGLAGDRTAAILEFRRYVTKDMADKEIAESKRLVREWKPGQCPGP